MQIENDYDKEVYNGDIGRVALSTSKRVAHGDFDGREVAYEAGELDRSCSPTPPRFTGTRLGVPPWSCRSRPSIPMLQRRRLHRAHAGAGSSWW